MVSDTIGDFIIRLKNSGSVGKDTVSVPYSKLRHSIADKLVEAGYLASNRIHGVKRVSKPGRRLYTKTTDIHPVKFGKGHMILSTPAGILTGEEAREKKVGGEQLFIIW